MAHARLGSTPASPPPGRAYFMITSLWRLSSGNHKQRMKGRVSQSLFWLNWSLSINLLPSPARWFPRSYFPTARGSSLSPDAAGSPTAAVSPRRSPVLRHGRGAGALRTRRRGVLGRLCQSPNASQGVDDLSHCLM